MFLSQKLAATGMLARFREKIRGRGLSVALPEGDDPRIIRAARILKDDELAAPIVLGKQQLVQAAVEKAGVSMDGIRTIDPKRSDKLDSYAARYVQGRQNISTAVAERMVAKPLFYAGMMVASGDADTAVGGVASATSTVIQAGALTVGLVPGIETVSSFFLMVIPDFLGEKDKPLIFADCAVNVDPTAEQLADIAITSAESAGRILDEEPRVALLSFSTRRSASGPSVDKVGKALEIIRARRPDLAVDGELQADSAVVPDVAERKVRDGSRVAGKANVIIFPNLDAGNIAYKLVHYMAGAQAIGPFLQGFAKPITDLSRGATVDDIVATVVLTLVQLL
jgi:phosphate acetyltransferase